MMTLTPSWLPEESPYTKIARVAWEFLRSYHRTVNYRPEGMPTPGWEDASLDLKVAFILGVEKVISGEWHEHSGCGFANVDDTYPIHYRLQYDPKVMRVVREAACALAVNHFTPDAEGNVVYHTFSMERGGADSLSSLPYVREYPETVIPSGVARILELARWGHIDPELQAAGDNPAKRAPVDQWKKSRPARRHRRKSK